MGYDHIGFTVGNFMKSRDFYISALAPLEIEILREGDGWAGFGENGRMLLWIGEGDNPPPRFHMAFRARDKAAVHAFHAAGIEAGGGDNGAPGYRLNYGPGYYAAFLFDPDGNNVEAVFREPAP